MKLSRYLSDIFISEKTLTVSQRFSEEELDE